MGFPVIVQFGVGLNDKHTNDLKSLLNKFSYDGDTGKSFSLPTLMYNVKFPFALGAVLSAWLHQQLLLGKPT